MHKTLTIILLLFSLMSSYPSYAEWSKIDKGYAKDYYLDYDKINKKHKYLYYEYLENYTTEKTKGLSSKFYNQADCVGFRIKVIGISMYSKPMGEGDSETFKATDEWINLHPNSSIGKILKAVCHSWKNGVRVSY